MKRVIGLHFPGVLVLFLLTIGLTTCMNPDFESEYHFLGATPIVAGGSDTGLKGENRKITGLKPGSYYKVIEGTGSAIITKYVTDEGILSDDLKDIGPISGTEITDLTNDISYRVNAARPPEAAYMRTIDVYDNRVIPPPGPIRTSETTRENGKVVLPNNGNTIWHIHLPTGMINRNRTYELMRISNATTDDPNTFVYFNPPTWTDSRFSGTYNPSTTPYTGFEVYTTDTGDNSDHVGLLFIPTNHGNPDEWSRGKNIIYSPVQPGTETTFLIVEYTDKLTPTNPTAGTPGNKFLFLTVEVLP